MNLPLKLPFFKKQSKAEYFLALVLRDEKISALIFEQRSEKISIVSRHEDFMPEALEKIPLAELVTHLDKVISHVESRLPADFELKNTVFGVKDDWVEEKKIKKDYLTKLKHICSELSLEPIGFIVLSEAIAHLIKQEEGAPITALLTEVGKFGVTVSLFKAGKLIETKIKDITTSPMHAVDEALKEFEHVEILPSRIILFHSINQDTDSEKDELTQQFIAHSWSKSLPFLQIPQISILPHEFDGKAIVAGAATQLGFSFTGLLEDTQQTDIQNIENKHSRRVHKEEKVLEENALEANLSNTDSEMTDVSTFGFVVDKDIANISPPPVTSPASSMTEANTIPPNNPSEVKHKTGGDFVMEEKYEVKEKKSLSSFIAPFVNKLSHISHRSLPKSKKILFLPPILILLLIVILVLYFFQVKATVTLIVSPKEVEETQRITFSTKSDNNFTQNIIAAKEITASLDGSSETPATGEKEVGDKAKGTITIYNSDTAKKTYKEGTEVSSEKGLVYLMDKEVSIASASGDIFTGIKSGTAQVSITALKIGAEYNLPSSSKFSITGTDVVAAKNEAALSGGSKKKVTVVTQKDVDKLENELPKSLESKAKEELQKKLGIDEELLSGFVKVDLTKKTLDNAVDKEAKNVKLTGTVSFKSIAYNKNDLSKFAEESIKERYTKEELSKDNINTKLSGLKDSNDSELTGIAAINAGLLPKIDIENMKKDLTSKSFSEVKVYAKNVSDQINDATVTLSPNLPFFPQMMPRLSKNINIIVDTTP
jgi:hypothetical protein